MSHTTKRCRFCRVITSACRCMHPHETEWTACEACLRRVAAGESLRDVSAVRPVTMDEIETWRAYLKAELKMRPDAVSVLVTVENLERLLDTATLVKP